MNTRSLCLVEISSRSFLLCPHVSVMLCCVEHWAADYVFIFRVGLTGVPVDKGCRYRFFAREVFIVQVATHRCGLRSCDLRSCRLGP